MRASDDRRQRELAPELTMFVPLLILRNALRHKLRTTLTVVGIVVAITAFGLLRTIVDAWYANANASSSGAARHAQRGVAGVLAAAHLRAEDPAGAGRGVGRVGELVRRRLHQRAQFLRRSSRSATPATSTCTRSSCCRPERAQGVRSPTARARSPAAGSPNSTAGRSATRSRCAARSIPGTWTFTLRGIYDGADKGTDQSTFFFHWDYLNEAIKKLYPRRARPDRRVHRPAQGPAAGRRGVARRSTRRSRTRSRKR